MSVLRPSTSHFGPVPRGMEFRLEGHMEHRREPMFVWWNTTATSLSSGVIRVGCSGCLASMFLLEATPAPRSAILRG